MNKSSDPSINVNKQLSIFDSILKNALQISFTPEQSGFLIKVLLILTTNLSKDFQFSSCI